MTMNVASTQSSGVAVTAAQDTDVYPYGVTVVAETSDASVEIRDNTDGSGPPMIAVKAKAGSSNRWVTPDPTEQWGANRFHVTLSGTGDPRALIEYVQR